MHHPHVLEFKCWYETSNHLWLIVEYCAGVSLHALLAQDQKLPESTVQMFAQDLLSGLQLPMTPACVCVCVFSPLPICACVCVCRYCHSQGVIMCELKPSNVLIDAHSMLKLSDFRVGQRVNGGPNTKYVRSFFSHSPFSNSISLLGSQTSARYTVLHGP